MVGDKKGRQLAVHVDQLKPYITLGEVDELKGLPLGLHTIKKIKSHRVDPLRGLELFVWWEGQNEEESEWLTHQKLVDMGVGPQAQEYITQWCT